MLGSGAVGAQSQRVRRGRPSDDHERARAAFNSGEIRSLSEILAELRSQMAGEVIEVELKRTKNAYTYEFKLLRPDGRVSEVVVDATSGKLIATAVD